MAHTPEQLREIIRSLSIEIQKVREEKHTCQGSALMRCCEEFRCEKCHIQHMMEEHSGIERKRWQKLQESSWITKDSQRKAPEPKAPKVAKPRSTETIITSLWTPEQIEEILRLVKERAQK